MTTRRPRTRLDGRHGSEQRTTFELLRSLVARFERRDTVTWGELEFNANDIVHGSYGIEENNIVISDALQLEDLDFSELQSSYESMVLAAASHMPVLADLVPVAQG